MKSSFLPISIFQKEPYSSILGYPKASKRQITSRISELKKLGITKVSFQGQTQIGNLRILGKGYVGVVVLAKKKNSLVALKIRRIDSQRDGMKNEARLLKSANKAKVGPKFIASSKNFILMEYLNGEKISDWVASVSGKGGAAKIKQAIRSILEECYKLDSSNIDHGELSSISKHVIVGKKITLIDFESSSTKRKVSNVTSATQAIFIGSGISKKVSRLYKIPRREKIIDALRDYKHKKDRKSFDDILKVLKV